MEAKIVVDILKFVGELVLAFIRGEDGPATKRLVEILPPELKSDLEHARQQRLLEAEIFADIDAEES